MKRTQFECMSCSKSCERYDSQIRNPNRVYCSSHCRGLASRAPRRCRQGYLDTANGVWIRISPEDQDLESYAWKINPKGYAYTAIKRKHIALHRLVMERSIGRPLRDSEHVDHTEQNPLDNRRHKLRLATPVENGGNYEKKRRGRSGYIGVFAKNGRWMARIRSGVPINIGIFDEPETAAWYYDQWAVALRGEYTVLNFEYVELASPTKTKILSPTVKLGVPLLRNQIEVSHA